MKDLLPCRRLFGDWFPLALIFISTGGCMGTPSTAYPSAPSPSAQSDETGVRVVTISDELERPWSLAFLPDGRMLVTEREGRLRIIRDGVLDPEPIAGVPKVQPQGSAGRRNGLMDIALHPRFAETRLLYLVYTKPGENGAVTTALARARYDGGRELTGVQDIFVAENWTEPSISQTSAARLVFGTDGMLYLSIGAPNATSSEGDLADARGGRAQDPSSHGGKVLRLHDDGTVPSDNPFVGRAGFRPEIYTLGHRNTLGMAVHPQTGEIWLAEAGPRDGDEINILKAGANYGWPLVGIGRDYTGDFIGGPIAIGREGGRQDAERFWIDGMEQPFIFWVPAVTPSGLAFYTGDKFAEWDGSLFVGTLGTSRLERFGFNDTGNPYAAEYLLGSRGQRIRDVRQGPDGFLYILTDHVRPWSPGDMDLGALLRIEPRN